METQLPSIPRPERTVSIAAGVIDSAALFGVDRVLVIRHGEATYQLRITAQNKMILTK